MQTPLLVFPLAMEPGNNLKGVFQHQINVLIRLLFFHRACIGQRFARLELYMMMVKVIQRFKMEYSGEDVGTLTRFASIPDKPINIKFIERK